MAELSQRRSDLDIARAWAMLAVVSNHIPQYFATYCPGLLDPAIMMVIISVTFRTSFSVFMFVSGMATGLSDRPPGSVAAYFRLVGKKSCRLILPFVAASLMTLVIKIGALHWRWPEASAAVLNIVIAPRGGPAPHLWFLYCLMSVFLIWPLFRPAILGRARYLVMALLFALALLPLRYPVNSTDDVLFGLKDLVWNLPIFLAGYLYAGRGRGADRRASVHWLLAGVILAGSSLIAARVTMPTGRAWEIVEGLNTMIGLLAGPLFLIGLSGAILRSWPSVGNALEKAGLRAYDIYLLHVALIGHPLVFLLSKLHPSAGLVFPLIVVSIAVTYLLPIVIGAVIRRLPPASFLLLGVPLPRKKPIAARNPAAIGE